MKKIIPSLLLLLLIVTTAQATEYSKTSFNELERTEFDSVYDEINYYNSSYEQHLINSNVTGQITDLFNLGVLYGSLIDIDNSYKTIANKYYLDAYKLSRENNSKYTPIILHNLIINYIKLDDYSNAKKGIDYNKYILDKAKKNNVNIEFYEQLYFIENIEYYYRVDDTDNVKHFLDMYNSTIVPFYLERALEIRHNLDFQTQESLFQKYNASLDFIEIWNVYDYDSDYYLVNISIIVKNNYPFIIDLPVLKYNLYNFEEIKQYSDNEEGNVRSMIMIDKALTQEEITQRYEKGPQSSILEGEEINQKRILFFPNVGSILNKFEEKRINIEFKAKKNDFLTRFATRLDSKSNSSYIQYTKEFNLFIDDNFISQIPPKMSFEDSNYEFKWTGFLNTNLPITKGIGPLGIPYPYINTNSSIGFVFGINKPKTNIKEFNEGIEIKEDEIKITRFESRKIEKRDNDLYIISTLYYPDTHTNNIKWTLETKQGRLEKTPLILTPYLLNKNLKIDYYEPRFTFKEDKIRDLIFKVPKNESDVNFEYSYTMNLSEVVTKLNYYTYSLNYTIIYTPGKFANNRYNYDFNFDDNYRIIESNSLSGCEGSPKENCLNYNCELSKFKPKEQIEIEFKDLKLENKYYNNWIIVIAILLVLFSYFLLYEELGLASTHLITLIGTAIVPSGMFVFTQESSFQKVIIVVSIYLFFLLIILNLNEKNKNIMKDLIKFKWIKRK